MIKETSDDRDPRFWSWHGTISCHAERVVVPETLQDLVDVLRDDRRYPSPVRPMGSRHSVTPCMAARGVASKSDGWGTAVDMTRFERGKGIDYQPEAKSVTVPAGRKLREISIELRDQHQVEFPMISEFGSLTMGAAACAATKQSSFPGESGQISSYLKAVEMVRPDGSVVHKDASDDEFGALRCSYGLFGIIASTTFEVVPSTRISVEHVCIRVEEFAEKSQAWFDGHTAVFLYLFPGTGHVVAALKRKSIDETSKGAALLKLRNLIWRRGTPLPKSLNSFEDWLTRQFLTCLRISGVSAIEQIVDFELRARKFTFSMWAFRAERFNQILLDYFAFCRKWRARGIVNSMPDVSYHIAQDSAALLSYSYDSDVWTLDPASPGNEPGWPEFLKSFNAFCSERAGSPLLNQTPWLEKRQLSLAYGARLDRFNQIRRQADPADRMLSDYFARIL